MTYEPLAKKGLGQHWLKDQDSLVAICQAAQIKPDDQILEIGPGTGELTKVLIESGAQITALEFDQDLIESLQKKFADSNVAIVQGDIRTFDLTQLPKTYKIVANIPYYLTANLLRLLTDTTNKPDVAILLVQQEVAERVAKQPGQMSFISAAVQLNYEVSLGEVIKANMFTPPPKVDSQILILRKLSQPRFTDVDYLQLIRFMKVGFTQPRKTLANNLISGLQIDRSTIEGWLAKSQLKLTVRAQELSLDNWHDLLQISNPSLLKQSS